MKIFNKVKKALTLLLATLVLSTVVVFNNSSVTVKAATNPVEFYSSNEYSYYISTYKTIYVKVNKLGSNEHVYIHQKTPESNDWYDVEANYLTTLSDGSQIFKVDEVITGFSIEYAIKYVVDGQTYWDNNNGNNYVNADYIGSAPIVVDKPTPFTSKNAANYNIGARVKNLAYQKVIKVRYTLDNWATYTEQSLNYQQTGSDGIEYWSTSLTFDPRSSSSFHYAVYYQVNGQTYWDNNFGSNYDF